MLFPNTTPLKVLVACESSGEVREAFRDLGHDAWSCDIQGADDGSPYHIKGDVRGILNDGWDLMIAHPPCTYLCISGMHWTARGLRDPQFTEDALAFVQLLMDAPIERIAIENPVGIIGKRIRPATQYIQPYEFGEDASKRTGLWLKNLPCLEGTESIPPRMVPRERAMGKSDKENRNKGPAMLPRWGNQTDGGQNKLGPSADRWKERSRTYSGIARAMDEQWGGKTEWIRVSFAGDLDEFDLCSLCGDDYAECACPGPMSEGYEFAEFHGVMYAKPLP